MTGGLLNIVSQGNQNVILNANPKKSFFKTTYAKYTNFGLQKFRIDFNGQKNLRMNEESRFTFVVPRYAELLMDTYIVVTLPTIWSPVYNKIDSTDVNRPYEFRWISNLGSQMVKEIIISVGGQVLQKYTGRHMLAHAQRDLDITKKTLYDEMTGNVAELNDPANYSNRNNNYPNVIFSDAKEGPEPSIRSRKLYIPLNAWFCNDSRCAFPLTSLQYNQLQIEVVLRPVRELFVTRDVNVDPPSAVPTASFIQPNFNSTDYQFYRFLQPPPASNIINADVYLDKRTDWNADVHLLSTYCFLSSDETRVFSSNEQKYLIKTMYEWEFKNVTGNRRIELQNTMGMVSSWTFFFQRDDINLRNEWSNYTNWEYTHLQQELISDADYPNIKVTRSFQVQNQREILQNLGILLNGSYRENVLESGVYNYVEKYVHTNGNAPFGLYLYSFALDATHSTYQPNGAINMSRFSTIELELSTYLPVLDPNAQFYTICQNDDVQVGVNKPNWNIYKYNYDLVVLEERYNVLVFVGGNCSLMFAR